MRIRSRPKPAPEVQASDHRDDKAVLQARSPNKRERVWDDISSAKEQWAFRLPASAILGAFDDSTAEKYMGRVQEALEEVDVELELVGTFAPLQYTVHLRVDLESETATVDGDTYCVSPQMADHINFFKLGLHRSKEAGHET